MTDLRKAAEMALEVFDGPVLKDATEHAMRLRKACDLLRQALAQPEQEPFIVDRGCWERGCMAYDWRDGDAVNMSQERVDETAKCEHDTLGSEWAECMKLPIVVHVRNQREGETHISTREGITPVLPDDLIMRGVAGEEYPIGRELFERTYTFGTAPPKREWVGLTNDDVHDAFNYVEMVKLLDFDRDRPEWCEAFARACEATLRHRNGEKQ